MFQFEKLDVYHRSKSFAIWSRGILKVNHLDFCTENQFRRASTSIMLNIAEGSFRYTNPDRKKYFSIARGSAFECYSILELQEETKEMTKEECDKGKSELIEISKILFALMRKWS